MLNLYGTRITALDPSQHVKTPRGCLGGGGSSQRAKRLGPTIYHLCKTIDAINIAVYYVGELASASHPREALISYLTGSAPLAASCIIL